MKHLFSQKGLTLIEIIVSIAILGMISVSFLAIFTNSFTYITKAGSKSKALFVSQQNMENNIALNGSGTPFTLSITFPGGIIISVDGEKTTTDSLTSFSPNN